MALGRLGPVCSSLAPEVENNTDLTDISGLSSALVVGGNLEPLGSRPFGEPLSIDLYISINRDEYIYIYMVDSIMCWSRCFQWFTIFGQRLLEVEYEIPVRLSKNDQLQRISGLESLPKVLGFSVWSASVDHAGPSV